MKNKILLLLLIVPFAIVFIVFLSTNVLINYVDADISMISWTYRQNEGIAVSESMELKAEPIFPSGYLPSEGNELVWTSSNEDIASISESDGIYYVKGIDVGESIITCSNQKGNVSRSFNLMVVDGPTILINDNTPSNIGGSISGINYYGQYDYDNDFNKIPAKTSLNVEVIGGNHDNYNYIIEPATIEDNYKVSISGNNEISFIGGGEVTVRVNIVESELSEEYTFNVVNDGVNIYDFEGLMHATNLSEEGEICVLKTNFVNQDFLNSEENQVAINNEPDIYHLFGDVNKTKDNGSGKQRIDYDEYLYTFETTFNRDYIDAFNQEFQNNPNATLLTSEVLVGVHIQKDFYGNGFSINLQDLTKPTNIVEMEGTSIYTPARNDYFKGPLTYYAINLNGNNTLVQVFGQDNIGFYVDGDDITINDVEFYNVDNQTVLNNYNYVGTVMELNGNNITIENSILGNGRNVVRDFSTYNKANNTSTNENILIDNCLLQNSREFLLKVGSNSYEKLTNSEYNSILLSKRNSMNTALTNLFNAIRNGNTSESEVLSLIETATNVQKIYDGDFDVNLDDTSEYLGSPKVSDENGNLIYAGNITVNDTYFYKAGLFSISMDTMFQGTVLYGRQPSYIIEQLRGMNAFLPDIGGTSYPSKLTLSGDTRFYDWKDVESINASSLISGGGYNGVSTDDFFPLKDIISNYISGNSDIGYTRSDGRTFVNGAIAYYGGGFNFSSIDITNLNNKALFQYNDSGVLKNGEIYADLAEYFALHTASGNDSQILQLIRACIPFASGFNPFKFNIYYPSEHSGDPTLIDYYSPTDSDGCMDPNLSDLINRA